MTDPEDLLQRYRPIGPSSTLRARVTRSSRFERLAPRIAVIAACVAIVLYGLSWRASSDLSQRIEAGTQATPILLGGPGTEVP